jgi:hypothetical protein
MALNLTELQAATDDYIYNHQPVDIYFKSNVLLYKLLKLGKKYNGGKKIQTFLEYGEGNSGSYGPKSELPINKVEIFNAAFFEYAAYFATLTMDMDDELINSGDLALINLLQGKLKNAEKTLRKRMSTEIYERRADNLANQDDPNAKPFNGLHDMFGIDEDGNALANTVAYGEIAENDMPQWKPNVITAEKTMSFKTMQEIRRTAGLDVTNDAKPDLYITTEELVDAFERTQQVQARYSDQKLLDVGFDNILFKGAPLVPDSKCRAGWMYGLNTKYLDVLTHSKRNFTKPEWQSPIRQPDTATANIRWAGNLVCKNRKAHVVVTNLVEPA